MGYETTVVQGVFFKRKSSKVTFTEKRTSCSNVNCRNHEINLNAKFCPECGSAVSEFEKNRTRKAEYIHDLIDDNSSEMDDLIFQPEYIQKNIFLLNFDIEEIKKFEIDFTDDDGYKTVDYCSLNPHQIIEKAKSNPKVQKVLEYFNSKYGDDFVTVHFGVCIYAN